jgi:hypothetical protein
MDWGVAISGIGGKNEKTRRRQSETGSGLSLAELIERPQSRQIGAEPAV